MRRKIRGMKTKSNRKRTVKTVGKGGEGRGKGGGKEKGEEKEKE